MADISDVENCLVRQVSQFLQLGTNYREGSDVQSRNAGLMCRAYRGWPVANKLDADLASGVTSVTVFPVAGASRKTTRFTPQWHSVQSVPRLIATVSGTDVTFSGHADVGQVAGVRVSAPGKGNRAYAYRIVAGDTPITVAAALATIIPDATADGATIHMPSSFALVGRVVADRTAWKETRRQEQHIWIMVWAPSPGARDKVSSVVDEGFANLTNAAGDLTTFIPLPDGSFGDLRYHSTATFDKAQQASAWRRDLRYTVDYPTTLIETFPEVLFADVNATEITTGTEFTIGF